MLSQSDAYIVSEVTPDHLLITVPGIGLGWPWLHAFLFVLFVIVAYTTSRSVRRVERPLMAPEKLDAYVWRYRVISLGITLSSLAAFWLIAYTSGSIELDRRTNLATVRAKFTAFLPAETGTIPLSAVDQATLDYGTNARRIRLVTNNGHDLSYPFWTDRAGQAEAVRTINRFLDRSARDTGEHGRDQIPRDQHSRLNE